MSINEITFFQVLILCKVIEYVSFFYFQLEDVKSGLVDLDAGEVTKVVRSLDSALHLQLKKKDSCSMTKRYSTEQLVTSFCTEVTSAYNDCQARVRKAEQFLAANVGMSAKLDEIFGAASEDLDDFNDDDDDDDSSIDSRSIAKQKDGTLSLSCPVFGCSALTVKLKRHLEAKHQMSPDHCNYAVMAARRMMKNKERSHQEASSSGTLRSPPAASPPAKHRVHQNTALVSRKHNLKQCLLCSRLVRNLSDHMTNVHKMNRKTHNDYDHYVSNAPCHPKCYTKMQGGMRVLLEGEELEDAKAIYGRDVNAQACTLDKLKNLRGQMAEHDEKMKKAATADEYRGLKKELEAVESEYRDLRYKDPRVYGANTAKWHDGFLAYLQLRENSNPKRGVNMAMDVLLPFESSLGRNMTLNDLVDATNMRQILLKFKESESLNSASKVKYLSMFDLFVEYLVCDAESPERVAYEDVQAKLLRDSDLKYARHEIATCKALISKRKGKDLAKSRESARDKLISEDELNDLLADINGKITSVLEDNKEQREKYSLSKIVDIRNCLIAAGTIRIGRRSKELMKMQLEEVQNAEQVVVEGDTYVVVKVFDQKNIRVGEPAPVTFTHDEFEVLKIFIQELRPKLINNSFETNVFPPKRHMKCASSKDLSFSSACRILKSFQTASGKKMTSRTIRGSKITSNRDSDCTDKERSDMAKAMSHSVSTAERYYNYRGLERSVAASLSVTKSRNLKSPMAASTPNQQRHSPIAGPSNMEPRSPLAGLSGVRRRLELSSEERELAVTSKKRRICIEEDDNDDNDGIDEDVDDDDDDEEEEDAERTLKVLRRTKIVSARKNKAEKAFHQEFVQERINNVVANLSELGNTKILTTKGGGISIQPITKVIPKNILRHFSQQELRKMILSALK